MKKGRAYLAHMRPDLEHMDSKNVDARITMAMCGSDGIPQRKGFFFISTPRVSRQIETKNGSKQDRSDPMPGCEKWNGTIAKPLGQSQIRVRLQHTDWMDAHKVECICQKSPFNGDNSAPGNAAFCRSDGEDEAGAPMAKRWNGSTFVRGECLGSTCYLREYCDTGKKDKNGEPIVAKAAKTAFTLIVRLDEEDLPRYLVSLATGSDVNYAEFVGCMEKLHTQWDALCAAHGFQLALPDYGIPLRLTGYLQTGGGSRYPRIDFAFDGNIEQLFEHVRHSAGRFRELATGMPSAERLITGEIDAADRAEIIAIDIDESQPPTPSAASTLNAATATLPERSAAPARVTPAVVVDATPVQASRPAAVITPVSSTTVITQAPEPGDDHPFTPVASVPVITPVRQTIPELDEPGPTQPETAFQRLLRQAQAIDSNASLDAVRTEFLACRREIPKEDQKKITDTVEAAKARMAAGGTK